jgi:exopolyphosphatase/guanosine-5'-triphosphate,3'-diphosphate pyrophosphatase
MPERSQVDVKRVGRQASTKAYEPPCYAALDLGTNNCRLLIATPSADGFRVVESFSRIVRLGDGLSRTGRLDEGAMNRTVAALTTCAEKIERRRAVKVRAVATQASRGSSGRPACNLSSSRRGKRPSFPSPAA